MILTKLNQNGTLYTTSTKGSDETSYIFVATNGTTKETVEVSTEISTRTPRIDVLPVDISGSIYEVGYWDYLLLQPNFDKEYKTITDIQLNHTEFIVERGKLLVTNEEGKVPSTEFQAPSRERKSFKKV